MATSSKARYLAHGTFYAELRRRVGIHFATLGCAPERGAGEVSLLPLGLWRSRAAPPDLAGGHVLRAGLADREPHDGRDIPASPLRGGGSVSRPRRGGGAGAY